MTKTALKDDLKSSLLQYVVENPNPELLQIYLYFIEKTFALKPVLFPKEKMIYQSIDKLIDHLEKKGALWHETEIKIGLSEEDVNEETKRIYICPFSGKVFGDNTHPNPQDAIYDWVATCPENTERIGGLRVKRFFVSEDPDVIMRYIDKTAPKEPVTKVVYSAASSGKLFNSKQGVIKDFKGALKTMTLLEVQSQNRFKIESNFLQFIQEQLEEDKITSFVEKLAEIEEFIPLVQKWVG